MQDDEPFHSKQIVKTQQLAALKLLAISDAIYALRRNSSTIQWKLFDVYQIAPDYPLEISLFADLFECNETGNYVLAVADKFSTNRTPRDNLKGLKLTCGEAVKMRNMKRKKKKNSFQLELLPDCLPGEVHLHGRSAHQSYRRHNEINVAGDPEFA